MIKEKIVNICIPKNIIEKILSWTYPFQLKIIIFLMDITRTLRYYIMYWGEFKWLKNIEWIEKYNISSESFDWKNKNEWISGYSRLKNAWDFIIPTIESAIDYFDEFILVENWSTDDTIEKCEYLVKKYPEKVKFFKYEPEIYPLYWKKFKECPENSVHNFSYMSNYTLSKVNYKYALKIDDDQIFINTNIGENLKNIRKHWMNNFIITPLINIQLLNNNFYIWNINFRSTFSWLFSDIWFHPVSKRIYFHSNGITEWYVHNYKSSLWPITFLHLKLLKPWSWFNNYDTNWLNYLKNNYKSNSFLHLEEKYIKLLHKYWINENW